MTVRLSPLAGKPAADSVLVDIPKLLAAYVDLRPDSSIPEQRIAFGTSGHRGCSFQRSFNEWHVLAISQAICDYRALQGIDGPLYLGIDTHALSQPAFESSLEVFAANSVITLIAAWGKYTPTPVVSHAILAFNRDRTAPLADGIVITPSHNPPDNGGFKYNPPSGGPAGTEVTRWIEDRANAILDTGLKDVRRIPFVHARRADTTQQYDFIGPYVADLINVIDLDAIHSARIRMAVDPLGGAGVYYWARIAERYRLDLAVVSEQVDPTFGFMTLDWDGEIRMDPSSPYAMQRLIALKDRYDIAFACDTDHDRHGIVTRSAGLLTANHYLSVAVDYLFRDRQNWNSDAEIGKTVVSSAMIDRIATALGRKVYEVPVGFKWYVDGLLDGALGFAGEESAGASFSRIDGGVWTTDKDGIVAALLSAEMTARSGHDPGERYRALTQALGECWIDRIDAPATAVEKKCLAKSSSTQLRNKQLAGEKIKRILDRAPGNDAPIGGIKVETDNGWFAARPSGTEDIYRIYAESFNSETHLQSIIKEAQAIVDVALSAP